MTADFVRLAASSDIADGQSRGFDPRPARLDRSANNRSGGDSDVMFVVRHQGQLYGWLNSCPHIPGSPMAWRKDAYLNASGSHVCCHAHGALFEPDTGLCVQGPCQGRHLTAVPGLYEEAGEIRLRIRAAVAG